MRGIFCALALLLFTTSTADAYVRHHRGYAHPVARGAAMGAAGAAGAAAVGAQRYYGGYQPYYGGYGQPSYGRGGGW